MIGIIFGLFCLLLTNTSVTKNETIQKYFEFFRYYVIGITVIISIPLTRSMIRINKDDEEFLNGLSLPYGLFGLKDIPNRKL